MSSLVFKHHAVHLHWINGIQVRWATPLPGKRRGLLPFAGVVLILLTEEEGGIRKRGYTKPKLQELI